MKVIVTGATSFIGTAAVRLLLHQGHQVCGVVRPGSKNLSHLWEAVPEAARERLAVAELDMKEIRRLEQAPEAAGADVWLHIGWDGAGSDNRMKRQVQQENVRNSLEAVRSAAALGCRRFLFTGSQAEYGVYHQETREDMPCRPVSEYGIAKVDFGRQAEKLCRMLNMGSSLVSGADLSGDFLPGRRDEAGRMYPDVEFSLYRRYGCCSGMPVDRRPCRCL